MHRIAVGELRPGMVTRSGRQIVSVQLVPPATVAVTCASGEVLRWDADRWVYVTAPQPR